VASCRNIGKLGRTIKSRKHPEQNLVNRYLLVTSVHSQDLKASAAEAEEDAEPHPLVPLGAVNSSRIRTLRPVVFPALTKHNSRVRYRDHGQGHVRDRIFVRYLGEEVTARNDGLPRGDWRVRETLSAVAVRVGPWKFGTGEDHETIVPGTCNAYFSILAKNIPAYADAHGDSAEFVPSRLFYGMIHKFVEVTCPQWLPADQVHHLAYCSIWRRVEGPAAMTKSGFRAIDVTCRLEVNGKPVHFIPLKHIHTQVMLAPTLGPLGQPTKHFVAIPLHV
jgi:hypothetical protein